MQSMSKFVSIYHRVEVCANLGTITSRTECLLSTKLYLLYSGIFLIIFCFPCILLLAKMKHLTN